MSAGLALTGDGALTLSVDPASETLETLVTQWQPSSARVASAAEMRGAAARIVVREGRAAPAPVARDASRAILTLGQVTGYAVADDRISLLLPSGPTRTELRLDDASADVQVGDAEGAHHLSAMLTLSSALLLGRMRRALVHGAAVVTPEGLAWLLVGDTHAGKTTTCATLLDGGWRCCSDDQVVVRRLEGGESGQLEVEGWLRVFHLDAGFGKPRPAGGVRRDVDAAARWPGRWLPRAPLAGLLFPTVEPAAATALLPIDAADRLAAVLRQSPWLFADPGAAPAMLELLRAMALLPGHRLRLGGDSFSNPARMLAVLETIRR